jgi:6,7-dimethyl-8-ribityllumazine synthase
MPHYEGELRAAPGARYAIVASRWNPRIVDALVDGARRTFVAHGVAPDAIDLVRVPGAWELPLAVARIASRTRHVGVVALGCVVRGDTRHYEHVADGCAQALMQVGLEHGVPIGNGVLAVERHEDAQARADGAHGNKGEEAALAVIEMADLMLQLDKGVDPA